MNQVIKKNFEIDKTKAKRLRSMGISGLFLQINKKNEQSSSKTPQNIDNLSDINGINFNDKTSSLTVSKVDV